MTEELNMAWIVNGERIEYSEVQREADRLRPQYEQTFADMDVEEREAQLMDWSRENVVERMLINQDARKSGREVPAEEVESMLNGLKERYEKPEEFDKDFGEDDEQKIKQGLADHLRVERRLEQVCESLPEPSDEDIRSYYERHKADYETGEQVRVAHIVKYVNWQSDEQTSFEAINRAHKELVDGAAFETVVDKYTDCGDNGGDLGYVNRGQMVEEFEDVVFNLGQGQVSDVFRTRFGFHIAKVYDRRPASIPPLEEVRKHIVENLKGRIREDAINDFIDSLKDAAVVEEV
mgnify:CR=1 FL=1